MAISGVVTSPKTQPRQLAPEVDCQRRRPHIEGPWVGGVYFWIGQTSGRVLVWAVQDVVLEIMSRVERSSRCFEYFE